MSVWVSGRKVLFLALTQEQLEARWVSAGRAPMGEERLKVYRVHTDVDMVDIMLMLHLLMLHSS